MSSTRRSLLQSGAALAAGLTGGVSGIGAQAAGQGRGQAEAPLKPASEVQVPKMKFFHTEISRVVLGVNPFYGFAHYNDNFSSCMREWYTPDRVCEVMHQANALRHQRFQLRPPGPRAARLGAVPRRRRPDAPHRPVDRRCGYRGGGEGSEAAGPAAAGRGGGRRLAERRDGHGQGVVQEGARPGRAGGRGHPQARK